MRPSFFNMTLKEMKDYLNITRDTAYQLVNDKKFYPAHKTTKEWFIDDTLLKQWISQQIRKKDKSYDKKNQR